MSEPSSTGPRVMTDRGAERRVAPGSGTPRDGAERRLATSDRRHDNNVQYTTFYLDNHFFGIEVLGVQEVLNIQEMTPVPLAPPEIAGLINLRGRIVMAIDLRMKLGFPPRNGGKEEMNVIVEVSGETVSLLVDRIGDVIEVHPDLFQTPPESLGEGLLAVIDGVYKLKEGLLLAMNAEKIIRNEGLPVREIKGSRLASRGVNNINV